MMKYQKIIVLSIKNSNPEIEISNKLECNTQLRTIVILHDNKLYLFLKPKPIRVVDFAGESIAIVRKGRIRDTLQMMRDFLQEDCTHLRVDYDFCYNTNDQICRTNEKFIIVGDILGFSSLKGKFQMKLKFKI